MDIKQKEAELASEHWIRLPKPGDRFYGLCRSTLDQLCIRGTIRSAVIKKPGAVRGIRLMYLPSFQEYLNGLSQEQKENKE